MVKVVQTLWFESISIFNQPFIDTPIGIMTLRQFLLIVFGIIISYFSYKIIPFNMEIKIGLSIIPLLFFLLISMKKVKTIPLEQYAIILLKLKRQRKKQYNNSQMLLIEDVPREIKKVLSKFIPPNKSISVVMNNDGSVTISEILKNPKTKVPLLNTKFYALIDNKIFISKSNEKGVYSIKFYPSGIGSYHMLIAVKGFDTPIDSILINVRGNNNGTL
jgi:hypothetical protein